MATSPSVIVNDYSVGPLRSMTALSTIMSFSTTQIAYIYVTDANPNEGSGTLVYNGVTQDQGAALALTSLSQFYNLYFNPGNAGVTDTLRVSVSDGQTLSTTQVITFTANSPPELDTTNITVSVGQAVTMDDVVDITDKDGNSTVSKVEIYISSTTAGATLSYNGTTYGTSSRIVLDSIDDLNDVKFTGASAGTTSITIGAYDGLQWQEQIPTTVTITTTATTTDTTTDTETVDTSDEVTFGDVTGYLFSAIETSKKLLAGTIPYDESVEFLFSWGENLGRAGDLIGFVFDTTERIDRINEATDKERQTFCEIFELLCSVIVMVGPTIMTGGTATAATASAVKVVAWYLGESAVDVVYDAFAEEIRDFAGVIYDVREESITNGEFDYYEALSLAGLTTGLTTGIELIAGVANVAGYIFGWDVTTDSAAITTDLETTDEDDALDLSTSVSGSYIAMKAGLDSLELANSGNTVTVSQTESVFGGTGVDIVTIGDGGCSTVVGNIESLIGGSGGDWITLGTSATMSMAGVETLLGSSGTDVVTLGNAGNTIVLAAIESLNGSSGIDVVTTGARGGTLVVSGIEAVSGGSGSDWISLGSSATLSLSGVETLLGSSGTDVVTLGNAGNTIVLAAIEALNGGSGVDVITTGARGGTLVVSGIEAVSGGSGGDWITLGASATITINGIETLLGSSGADAVALGNAGNTLVLAAIESLNGGSGVDVVTTGARGGTLVVSGIEAVSGGSGGDWITLGTSATISMSGVETLLGSSGIDGVTLGNAGNTIALAAIESLNGGSGVDVITLGARGVTVTVSNVESIAGGDGNDAITLSSVTLETVIFSGSVGTDRIYGFSAGDKVAFTGSLLTALDDNADSVLAVASRTQGSINLSIDEMVFLSSTVTSLEDSGYASFRTALGSLTGSSVGAECLVFADDGSNTGLYLVTDADGNGTIDSAEVKILATASGTVMSTSNLALVA